MPNSTEPMHALVQTIRTALLAGERATVEGLGTFSPCTRKAKAGRPACTTVMWRASASLRAQLERGEASAASGPHARAVGGIIEGMHGGGCTVPELGFFGSTRAGPKTRLVFRLDPQLMDDLNVDEA